MSPHPSLPSEDEWPASIRALPREHRGFPILWFADYHPDGTPELRAMDPRKWVIAMKERRCWVCGEKINEISPTFVIGPMCVVNRTTAEPPCHLACALFSARACPFLSRPKMVRRTGGLPIGDKANVPGQMLDRNPGATALYSTSDYKVFNAGNGPLLRLGKPSRVRWFTEGRFATRDEIEAAFEKGLPTLREMAEQDGPEALAELARYVERARRYLPAAA